MLGTIVGFNVHDTSIGVIFCKRNIFPLISHKDWDLNGYFDHVFGDVQTSAQVFPKFLFPFGGDRAVFGLIAVYGRAESQLRPALPTPLHCDVPYLISSAGAMCAAGPSSIALSIA